MKIRAVETGFLHEERRVDRWTDMTKLIVAFHNFVKVLNNACHFFCVRQCLISATEKSVIFFYYCKREKCGPLQPEKSNMPEVSY